ncbi:MAG TPA: hypothetical protein VFV99_33000 [Kofleriaceae bacterium]|nr:hypothetical protein [Kofleriaceae bacterium]
MSKLAICLVTLCMLGSPVLATPTPTDEAPAVVEKSPAKKAASSDELQQYAQREHAAEKLAKFEGGRGGNDTLVTVILVLVIVILVLAIVH